MRVDDELHQAWEKAGRLQAEMMSRTQSLDREIEALEQQSQEEADAFASSPTPAGRVSLLSSLCLLSELCSAVDFDRMIEAREKFQDLLPNHFEYYLKHLDSMSWHVAWSGCLECRHFQGKCTLNLTPVEVSEGSHHLAKTCSHKAKRSKNL